MSVHIFLLTRSNWSVCHVHTCINSIYSIHLYKAEIWISFGDYNLVFPNRTSSNSIIKDSNMHRNNLHSSRYQSLQATYKRCFWKQNELLAHCNQTIYSFVTVSSTGAVNHLKQLQLEWFSVFRTNDCICICRAGCQSATTIRFACGTRMHPIRLAAIQVAMATAQCKRTSRQCGNIHAYRLMNQ